MSNLIAGDYDWESEESYPVDRFFQLLDSAVEEHFYGLRHPLCLRWLDGQLSREDLQFIATQEYWYYWGTTWWNAYKLANADQLDQQRRLHNALFDELGTDLLEDEGLPAHSEIFLEYCAGLGLAREQVLRAHVLPAVLLAVTELLRISQHRPHYEFIAASNLVAERMRPRHYAKVLAAMRRHYSWVPDEALRFYEIHATLDVAHMSTGRSIVAQYVSQKRDQDAVMSAVVRSLGLRHVMYDGIEAGLRDPSRACIAVWPNFPRDPWPRPVSVATVEARS